MNREWGRLALTIDGRSGWVTLSLAQARSLLFAPIFNLAPDALDFKPLRFLGPQRGGDGGGGAVARSFLACAAASR